MQSARTHKHSDGTGVNTLVHTAYDVGLGTAAACIDTWLNKKLQAHHALVIFIKHEGCKQEKRKMKSRRNMTASTEYNLYGMLTRPA